MTDDSLEFGDVFRALGEWARTTPHGVRAGGGRGGFDHIQLHARPDPREPEVQLTLLARLVAGRPVIVVFRSPSPTAARRSEGDGRAVVTLGTVEDEESRSLGRDPAAVCEACGALGTVGRAARTDASGEVTEMHRFCFGCWPEQAARYRARWEEEDRRRSMPSFAAARRQWGLGPACGSRRRRGTVSWIWCVRSSGR